MINFKKYNFSSKVLYIFLLITLLSFSYSNLNPIFGQGEGANKIVESTDEGNLEEGSTSSKTTAEKPNEKVVDGNPSLNDKDTSESNERDLDTLKEDIITLVKDKVSEEVTPGKSLEEVTTLEEAPSLENKTTPEKNPIGEIKDTVTGISKGVFAFDKINGEGYILALGVALIIIILMGIISFISKKNLKKSLKEEKEGRVEAENYTGEVTKKLKTLVKKNDNLEKIKKKNDDLKLHLEKEKKSLKEEKDDLLSREGHLRGEVTKLERDKIEIEDRWNLLKSSEEEFKKKKTKLDNDISIVESKKVALGEREAILGKREININTRESHLKTLEDERKHEVDILKEKNESLNQLLNKKTQERDKLTGLFNTVKDKLVILEANILKDAFNDKLEMALRSETKEEKFENLIAIDKEFKNAGISLKGSERRVLYERLGFYAPDSVAEIKYYSLAIESGSPSIPSLLNRGLAFRARKSFDKALKDFDKALTLAPNNVKALNNRSLLYEDMLQYDKALEDLNKLISIQPNEIGGYLSRARIFLKSDRYEDGVKAYEELMTSFPKVRFSLDNQVALLVFKGMADDPDKHFDMASKRILEISGDNEKTHLKLTEDCHEKFTAFLKGKYPEILEDENVSFETIKR